MALTQEDRNEILQIAADAFVKANKRSRNDVGRGDPELGQILQKAIARTGESLGEVSRAIGKHPTFMGKVIRGERGISISTLAELHWYFGGVFSVRYLDKLYQLEHPEQAGA
jgi:plasmid maintenance system antidote protein VapI